LIKLTAILKKAELNRKRGHGLQQANTKKQCLLRGS
jgi:hypothetical protein